MVVPAADVDADVCRLDLSQRPLSSQTFRGFDPAKHQVKDEKRRVNWPGHSQIFELPVIWETISPRSDPRLVSDSG